MKSWFGYNRPKADKGATHSTFNAEAEASTTLLGPEHRDFVYSYDEHEKPAKRTDAENAAEEADVIRNITRRPYTISRRSSDSSTDAPALYAMYPHLRDSMLDDIPTK